MRRDGTTSTTKDTSSWNVTSGASTGCVIRLSALRPSTLCLATRLICARTRLTFTGRLKTANQAIRTAKLRLNFG